MVSALPGQASAARPGPQYEIDHERVAAEITMVEDTTGQEVLSGEIAGAAWIGQIPDNWNGDLVIYAHGYRGEDSELYVDAPPAYQFLTASGYAWAASSYRRNSYDPGIGVIDTKNVTRMMQNKLKRQGDLDKTYLTGFSMGGHVTAAAIEKYPNMYDGALPACGVMGDVELFDYFLDYNVGSAAIAGLAPDYTYPDDQWTLNTVPDIKAGLSTDPTGQWAGGFAQILGAPSPLTAAGEDFKDFVEIGSGGERVTYDAAWNFWHGLADPSGNFFFGLGNGDGTIANRPGIVSQNTDMTYLDEYGFDIDDQVVRIEAAKRVRKAMGNKPAPIIEGKPSIPVLSIHTTGDLFVPIEMQQIYGQEVMDNGRGDLLVQRAIRDIGHCTFTGEELVQSYIDLFAWVETGVKPAGEDLIGDISSPSLGCAFTAGEGGSGFRGVLEPCP
jgi:pimeloyl-ACP methyl ester carboxylesterase